MIHNWLYLLVVSLSLATFLLVLVLQTHVEVRRIAPDFSLPSRVVRNRSSNAKNNPIPERRLPHAIIIGARKSGTRALAIFLGLNPAIKSARNEIHFFDREQNYELGLDWYRKQMPKTGGSELTIEKSPAYFVTKNVPERIKAMNASTKLILILRDPVTRLISDFSQLVANRIHSSLGDFEPDYFEPDEDGDSSLKFAPINNETAVWQKAEKAFEKHVLRQDGGIDDQKNIVKTGMYAIYIEKWFETFPPGQIHFVDGEKLIKTPHLELQKLESFLGFKQPRIKKEHFVFSFKKGFYCIVSNMTTRERLSLANANAPVEPICLGKSKGRRHVKVSDHLISKLETFYAPYNEYLLSITGLNFTKTK